MLKLKKNKYRLKKNIKKLAKYIFDSIFALAIMKGK